MLSFLCLMVVLLGMQCMNRTDSPPPPTTTPLVICKTRAHSVAGPKYSPQLIIEYGVAALHENHRGPQHIGDHEKQGRRALLGCRFGRMAKGPPRQDERKS